MHPAAIRPRFLLELQGSPDELIERVVGGIKDPSRRCVCRVVGRHVDITVAREDRHRFSPCLALEFEPTGTGTRVRGLVGPHPNVWTFYALTAIALVFLLLTALCGAYAQHVMDDRPWALWWALAFALLLAGMYAASQIGRRLARDQTSKLMRVLSDILGIDTLDRSGN